MVPSITQQQVSACKNTGSALLLPGACELDQQYAVLLDNRQLLPVRSTHTKPKADM